MNKFMVALSLILVAMASAEPPRYRPVLLSKQVAASQNAQVEGPYQPRGWRPSGPAFPQTAPIKQSPAEPSPSYGPPPKEAEPTTQAPRRNATQGPVPKSAAPEKPVEAENIKVRQNGKVESAKIQQGEAQVPQGLGAYYVVLPQAQNLVYAQQNAAYVASPSARLEALPVVQNLQAVPVFGSSVYSEVQTPYSATFLHILQ